VPGFPQGRCRAGVAVCQQRIEQFQSGGGPARSVGQEGRGCPTLVARHGVSLGEHEPEQVVAVTLGQTARQVGEAARAAPPRHDHRGHRGSPRAGRERPRGQQGLGLGEAAGHRADPHQLGDEISGGPRRRPLRLVQQGFEPRLELVRARIVGRQTAEQQERLGQGAGGRQRGLVPLAGARTQQRFEPLAAVVQQRRGSDRVAERRG